MSEFRSLLFALFQLVFTPIYAVLVLLMFWLPPIARFKFIIVWCGTNLLAARWICGIRHRVIGAENIPRSSDPHIVMSKHSSTWETLALNFLFPPLAFVAKKELLSIPFFGWAFALASPITIAHQSGLSVRAPSWVSIREIELALRERAEWVIKTLAEWRGRDKEALPAQWCEGAGLLYRGRPLTLALFPARKKTIAADLLHLTVLHPNPGDEGEIAAFVGRWLKEQALALLAPRVLHFASQVTGVSPAVKLSSARTQWGSCNHKGEIRLHWRLVQLPPAVADYVIAHEVAHLVELNHSPRFWALVESLLPGHAEARRELDALTPVLG